MATVYVLTRVEICECCGGEGEVEHITGYSPRDGQPTGWVETCGACDGSGMSDVECEPAGEEFTENDPLAMPAWVHE